MTSTLTSVTTKSPSSLNEQQIALRLGWSLAEIVGRITRINRRRSQKRDRDKATSNLADGGSFPQPAATGASSPPDYAVGRTLTLTEEKGSDNAGLSDTKKLWFLSRTVVRLCTQAGISPKESFEAILPQLREFPRQPSDHAWRELFHACESLNTEVMVEFAARDPLSAKAYRAGKLLAQLFWALPSAQEVRDKLGQVGYIDAYTLLRGLETHRMAELIGDFRELQQYVAEDTFPALASSISAWEIKGMLEKDGKRLKLRRRPRLPGLRLTIAHIPVLRRLFPRGLLSRLRPPAPPPENVRLSAHEAGMIWQNLRDQSSIWRGLIFETRGPSRLPKPSDWFRINFTVAAVLCLGALAVVTSLAALGLGLAFFAGPGIADLARVAYGDEEFEGFQIVRSLSAAPLLTAAAGVLAQFRNAVGAVREARGRLRARLIGNAIRQQAVRRWNEERPRGQRMFAVKAVPDESPGDKSTSEV